MSFWGILARGRQGEGELEGRDQGGSYRYVDRMHPFCRVLVESPRKNSDDTLKTDKISKLSPIILSTGGRARGVGASDDTFHVIEG